ncbi:MAG TPA: multicopper oxidase domain-containing protein [Candidatus Thermoplasmatota archaeon]|nr:multicopper oxidase domain-containing protein [Candidatus Thermoplasmatota archaeon]
MPLSRRAFVKGAALAGTAAVGAAVARKVAAVHDAAGAGASPLAHTHGHGLNDVNGAVSTADFDPHRYLTEFYWGDKVTPLPDGTSLREYTIVAEDKDIEVAPGVVYPAWTFNGQLPGPTIRAVEGDTLRIRFVNKSRHPHTMHFHGFHAASQDGVPGMGGGNVFPDGELTYEFKADPHGVHLYHCHTLPVKKHIAKGLYGAYVVDPKDGFGPEAHEMVMVMNSFDTDFDGENEVYAVNTKAFAYAHHPIRIRKGQLQRVFLVNVTEHDPINSMHLHGNFFHYVEVGHKSNPRRFTDNVALIQGERGMMEFTYERPGRFMFHAHQSEFTELGWMGVFEVEE